MTDASLMEADCIHGVVWYDCQECDYSNLPEPLPAPPVDPDDPF